MSEVWHSLVEVLRHTHNWLLVGLAVLLGHLGGKIAGRLRLPSVVGYLVVGVALGVSISGVIDKDTADALALITDFGLGIVAFMIGAELSVDLLRRFGKDLTWILFSQFLGTVLVVFLAVFFLADFLFPQHDMAFPAALVFAAVASATAPAGTVAVVQEMRAKGPMTTMLLAVVGLDDGLAIVIYAFAAAVAKVLLGGGTLDVASVAGWPALEILGSLVLGAALGAALTAAVSRTKSRAEMLSLTLGAILLTTGLCNALHLSLILANLTLGVAVVNISRRDAERAYSGIERMTHPVYILFFVVAGAHLDLRILLSAGLLAFVYITARSIGKVSGALVGAVAAGSEANMRRYLGLGLLSQAGVAVGLALLAARTFSAYGEAGARLAVLVINTVAASTIFFEIVGPIAAKVALVKSGEANAREEDTGEDE